MTVTNELISLLAIIIILLMSRLTLRINYFNFLENILDILNYCGILLEDFNIPGFDWNYGLPSPNCHFYTN
jgi:hypothetical protein